LARSNGLVFGGGTHAIHQLGVETLGIAAVMTTVFALSFATVAILARALGGITHTPTDEYQAATDAIAAA
jgi:ammonia channel protein AmtB